MRKVTASDCTTTQVVNLPSGVVVTIVRPIDIGQPITRSLSPADVAALLSQIGQTVSES